MLSTHGDNASPHSVFPCLHRPSTTPSTETPKIPPRPRVSGSRSGWLHRHFRGLCFGEPSPKGRVLAQREFDFKKIFLDRKSFSKENLDRGKSPPDPVVSLHPDARDRAALATVLFASRPVVDCADLFAERRPVEIEIGSGKGSFLLAYGAQHPERNVLGIENQPRWVRWVERRMERAPRANVRILCADAALVIQNFLVDASIHAYHLYFPDPWWKRRHQGRRLVRAELATHLFRTLEPGGMLHLATDVADRFEAMQEELSSAPFVVESSREPTPIGRPLTNFERKYRAEGRLLYYAVLTRAATARGAQAPPASGGNTLIS
jgi:tRNA (guanine-N7-)-methyltransferase